MTEARFHPFAKKGKERIRLLVHLCAVSIKSTSKIVGTDVVDYLKVFARDAKLGRNDQ